MCASQHPTHVQEMAQKLLQDKTAVPEFIQYLLENLGPEGQQWVADRLLQTTPSEDGDKSFASLIGARQVDSPQRQAMELAALSNFFNYRKSLLSSAVPATKAAEILGVSRTTIHERIRGGQLLGVLDNNIMKMPTWQFDAEGPNGAVQGLDEVLAALSCSVLAKISWMSSPNPVFSNKPPIDALKNGKIDEVVREARAVETV